MTTRPAQPVRRFPPHPVRGVSVHHIRQTSCGGPFAIIGVDFEPLPDGVGAPVVVDWPVDDRQEFRDRLHAWPEDREWVGLLKEALERGIREALDALPSDVRPAVRCAVTELRWHPVDTSERGFQEAGEMAVARARHRCGM